MTAPQIKHWNHERMPTSSKAPTTGSPWRRSAEALCLALIAVGSMVTTPALASTWESLSDVERAAADAALTDLDLEPEPSPEGRTIGRIHVSTREVFEADSDGLRWANLFHWTTKQHVVEREVLLRPGEVWDEQRVAESERNLRNPLLRSVVAILPVKAPGGGPDQAARVDLLVVTRDIWSLRGNTNFQTTGSVLNFLSTSLSENNFFGLNKQVAATFKLDQDTYDVGALYSDPRLYGSPLSLYVDESFLIGKDSAAFEGAAGTFVLRMPLRSVHQRWGFDVSVLHVVDITRDFQGDAVRTWDDPGTEAVVEEIPREYDYAGVSMEATAVRSFGESIKTNMAFGWGLRWQDAASRGGFVDDAQRARYEDALLPRRETASYGIFKMDVFHEDYVSLYDVETFALVEEIRTGPSFGGSIRWSSQALFFSERDFAELYASLGWSFDLGEGAMLFVNGTLKSRLEGTFTDSVGTADVRAFTPVLGGFARLHARVFLGGQWDETRFSPYTLGGDSGLRGRESRSLFGTNVLRTNLELRTLSLGWWIFKAGLVAFWDGGTTFESFDDVPFVHTVGMGARILIVPVNRNVLRLDYAVPLNGTVVGFEHGVFTAGFDQAF